MRNKRRTKRRTREIEMSFWTKLVFFFVHTMIQREVFGKGSILGWKIIGATPEYLINTTESSIFGWYSNNNLMVLPASAMFLIAIMIWLHRTYNQKLIGVS